MPYLPALHTPEDDRVFFREQIFRKCDVWVAERGEIVGYCAFRDGWVDHLYVHPSAHGGGLGSALLKKAMDAYPALKLWVFQRNHAAIRFYEAKGFELVKKTDGRDNQEHEPDALYAWSKPVNR